MDNLLTLIEKGGFAMYPLLILSIISWAIIVERALNVRRSPYRFKSLDQVKSLLISKDIEGAIKILNLSKSEGEHILSKVLDSYSRGKTKEQIMSDVDLELSLVASKLEKNLPILSTVASVSPLLGLFGTITGLIKVFSAFATAQMEEGMLLLSKGISEALIAAATGLAVAIPALLAYWIFKVIAINILNKLEEEIVEIMRLLG